MPYIRDEFISLINEIPFPLKLYFISFSSSLELSKNKNRRDNERDDHSRFSFLHTKQGHIDLIIQFKLHNYF